MVVYISQEKPVRERNSNKSPTNVYNSLKLWMRESANCLLREKRNYNCNFKP
jgi:hypothetical protein